MSADEFVWAPPRASGDTLVPPPSCLAEEAARRAGPAKARIVRKKIELWRGTGVKPRELNVVKLDLRPRRRRTLAMEIREDAKKQPLPAKRMVTAEEQARYDKQQG